MTPERCTYNCRNVATHTVQIREDMRIPWWDRMIPIPVPVCTGHIATYYRINGTPVDERVTRVQT